ncbi:MAG: hypothetical protein GAK45_01978 [Pseudomonas citronellolis]|nr:MAG: hypothetical protein GAK45_01978 [Pseudomonas citronellolis]
MEDFVDVDQRESEGLVAQHHHQGRHDREGQRHLDDDLRALALGRVDVDDAVELGNLGLHHIHAHAAAGHVGNLGLGREAGGEDQVEAVGFAQAFGSILVQQALLHRLGAEDVRVHAFAVIGDRQQDMVAFLFGRQHHPPGTRLARGFALFRAFDAMVDSVAHQVHQRIGQGLDQVLVEVGFLAHQLEVDFLLQVARQVADQSREAPEDFLDRLHAGLHDRHLQIGGDHIEVGHGLGHGLVAAVAAQAHQAVTHQHQLADHVHDFVQACGIYPNGGLRLAGALLVDRSGRARRFGRFGRGGGPGGRSWRRSGRLGGLGRCAGSRCRRSGRHGGIGAELALAVQLVEQRFEFVVGDVIVGSTRRGTGGSRRFLGGRSRGLGRGSARRSSGTGELALAVQLVEQRFEFVVGDVVLVGTRRSGWRLAGRRRRTGGGADRTGELALAVQLVEQRFEFVVADLVARALGGAGHTLANAGRSGALGVRLQGIHQLLELGVGNVAIAGSCFAGRRSFRLRRRSGRLGLRRSGGRIIGTRLGQASQGREQLGRGRGRFLLVANLVEHHVEGVQRLQHHVHQLGADAALTLAQDVEDVFGNVAALHQRIELEEACTTLDGVEATENSVEQIHVIRAAFQLDQLLGQLLEDLAGLHQEVLADFFIGVEAHAVLPTKGVRSTPQKPRLDNRSSTSS